MHLLLWQSQAALYEVACFLCPETNRKANLIWEIATHLVGLFKPHEYGKVILPMTVLKRFDDALAPTKKAVVEMNEKLAGMKVEGEARDGVLCKTSGYAFYNTSKFDFKKLVSDPNNIESNFENYLQGFSSNVKDIISNFKFTDQVKTMADGNIKFVSPVKSIGHGITTVVDLSNEAEVWRVLLELTQAIGHKLRVHQKAAKGVAIYVRDNTLFSKQWQTQMDMVTQSPFVLAQYAFRLFKEKYDWRNPIRSLTIQAINLFPQDMPQQIDLFIDYDRLEKQEKLDNCIDKLRERFGKRCIRNAVLIQELGMPMGNIELTMPTGLVK